MSHPLYVLPEKISDQFSFKISPTLLAILKIDKELILMIDGEEYRLTKVNPELGGKQQ